MAAGSDDVARAAMNSRSNSGTKSEVRAPSSVTRWLTRRYALHRIRDTGSSDAFVALFTCQTARVCSFPRRVFCARGLLFRFAHPNEGWRSAERRTDACEASVGPARYAAGQAPTEAPCVPIRGTPASRRSTVAILGSGPTLPSPAFPPDPYSELLAARS